MLATYYDVIKLLQRYGIYIYTGKKMDDIDLIHEELKELYDTGLILKEDYLQSILIIQQEKRMLT
ncbi:MAG TPA: YqgQ family protein [Sporosarcina sp.]|nr:YqgQ family protein [Sporosarcina sp.]